MGAEGEQVVSGTRVPWVMMMRPVLLPEVLPNSSTDYLVWAPNGADTLRRKTTSE